MAKTEKPAKPRRRKTPLDSGEVSHRASRTTKRQIEAQTRKTLAGIEYICNLDLDQGGDVAAASGAGATLAGVRQEVMALRAQHVAEAMMTSNVPTEMTMVLYNRARRALYALTPVVVMRLAQKMDDASAPGSERVLISVAKGLGLLAPEVALDTDSRAKVMAKKDLMDLSDEELAEKMEEVRGKLAGGG